MKHPVEMASLHEVQRQLDILRKMIAHQPGIPRGPKIGMNLKLKICRELLDREIQTDFFRR